MESGAQLPEKDICVIFNLKIAIVRGRPFCDMFINGGPVIEIVMARKPYRVEINYPKKGSPQYFLVKDVKVKGKKRKVKKYLGISPPNADDLERYRQEYAYEIELKATKKRAELSSSFFTSDYLSKEQIQEIEELRYLYKIFKSLLTTNEIEAYEQNFEIHYIQGTTSIEGNTISLQEAYNLLSHGIAPQNKPLREINEVQNFKKVKEYRDKFRGKVNTAFIKILHSHIMSNIDFESAGMFRRTDDIGITGCDVRLTPSIMVEDELYRIIDEYYTKIIDDSKHPFEQAAMFHYKFEMIHPFADGNGRVGREIFNYMLTRADYPKLLFLGKDRDTYIQALLFGNEEKYSEMIHSFLNLILTQRLEIVKENLKNIVTNIKRGQMRLTDFTI